MFYLLKFNCLFYFQTKFLFLKKSDSFFNLVDNQSDLFSKTYLYIHNFKENFFFYNLKLLFFINSNCLKFTFIGLCLFFFGLVGMILTRKNILRIIICGEIMFAGVWFLFVSWGFALLSPDAFIVSIILLAIAAAESVTLLSLLIMVYSLKRDIDIITYIRTRS